MAECAVLLAKGIRSMPVICEHPDWWSVVIFDGFSSHVTVVSALQVFFNHKIITVKEEGDSSGTNQPFDLRGGKVGQAGNT